MVIPSRELWLSNFKYDVNRSFRTRALTLFVLDIVFDLHLNLCYFILISYDFRFADRNHTLLGDNTVTVIMMILSRRQAVRCGYSFMRVCSFV